MVVLEVVLEVLVLFLVLVVTLMYMMIPTTSTAAVQWPRQASTTRVGQADPVMVRPEASNNWCTCVPQ